ncbi:MAG: Type 1 glutamine amidotransferase-like domain-containing protein [Chloroflexi bacterium]|nr:Type 1 glutamine amidotransferase-like domain-containing protein [Chloroflexota bacterium]
MPPVRGQGYILLEGGAEFGGQMAVPDRRAIALAGGWDAPISIIPAAAAPDHNHERAGRNGREWFSHLGAKQVQALPLIDKASANDATIVATLRASRLIYLLGGFTHYLGQTLAGSASWQAIVAAYHAGAVVAGSSAGAMVLCQYYYDPGTQKVVDGLNVVENALVIPHHNTFGKGWAPQLAALTPSTVLLGIDERTGMIDDGQDNAWRIYGQGRVTLYHQEQIQTFHAEDEFRLEL